MPARPLRRSVAVLACLAVGLLPQPASSSLPPPAARAGDAGSGPPTWQRLGPAATSEILWSDVGRRHWARAAIDHVAGLHRWMRDHRAGEDGRHAFRPDAREPRRLLARALVRAFGAGLEADPALTFADLPQDHRFHRVANVAVSQGWMETVDGAFRPRGSVTPRDVHRALVLALGLGDLAAGADALHLEDGTRIPTPEGFGTLLIGMRLGLRYDHADAALDVGPDDPLSRAEVAWSLYRAATAPSWVRESLAPYGAIELPTLSPELQEAVAWGARFVGYPYVWGGEWAEPTPPGYCCGSQPTGGFDCSGITWWVMRDASGGWDNAPPRAYEGWALPERSSASMASVGPRLRWSGIQPGDLLFYDGNDDGTVDHVNTYIGNGWAIDSGGGSAGVTIAHVLDNWFEEHFVRGRRITG